MRSSSLSSRKTEAWALTLGVRIPLEYPSEYAVSRAQRGRLPDVMPETRPPARRGFSGLGSLLTGLFGVRGAVASQRPAVVAALPAAATKPHLESTRDAESAARDLAA